ncbi:hypothetical protein ABEW33_16100 [Priestia megaterium]|uniref:hypothetical protein n=1 Tax=Priestia TaxID=2800373 RepID=UPI00034D2273|nr:MULTISPECIES: hypothetical protein [Priestia]AYE51632.1 hypothetical protein OEA_18310 [Priestia megaterium NCT-2]MBU3569796.1 hypothetical protein [Priestia aryabhattai]MCR8925250.1 hypothetical protein [Priestia megaterium]UMZ34998.1 hypothetical protein MGJ28_10100 [Priestia megaterium]WDL87602.1 hypothetical protein IUJ58_01535 [Priestia aryabhattai]
MTNIHYQSIKVNKIQNSSGLFYGVNIQYKWNHKSRISDGFGKIIGDSNKISNNTTVAKISKKNDE